MQVTFDDLPKFSRFVLVDGAFDPLHAGHIEYIKAARALNRGPLLCAVASDDQIREKGREPLLPQSSRVAVLEALCDAVYAKDRPTEYVIRQMRPARYVKGVDWVRRLPQAQLDACEASNTDIEFVSQVADSSTARLRAWALKDAEQSLDRLQACAHAQAEPTFDREYFTGEWRTDVGPYTWESRKAAEGRHPKIVKECFDGLTVLDVGCGPGFFVRMLRELGMDAGGIDISPDAVALSNGIMDRVIQAHVSSMPPKIAHVVICRECLEHVPVLEIAPMVADLFRVARKFVYITTRFNQQALFDCATDFETDPTHISLLTQPALRNLCVLNGGKRRRDLETKLDHMGKGRVLVYEV